MSAGIPGIGLGGLFIIFSALLGPLRQLRRSRQGQSRPGEWRMVGRQFAQAVAIVVAIDLSLRLVYLALAAMGIGDAAGAATATVIPLTLVGLTTGLLAAVLAAAKLADLVVRVRGAGRDTPRVAPVARQRSLPPSQGPTSTDSQPRALSPRSR